MFVSGFFQFNIFLLINNSNTIKVFKMKQDQKTELLKIGATLEKGAGHKIVVNGPSGTPMFFRAGGLQVIPCESEELDTGGSCVLIISSQAALLSGVIIRCLRVLDLQPGREQARKVVKEMGERLVRDRGQAAGTWEGQAAKDLVTIALKWAERPVKRGRSDSQQPDEESPTHPLTGEPMPEELISHWRMAKRRAARQMREGEEDILMQFTMEACASGKKDVNNGWVVVGGVQGVIAGDAWYPVVGPEDRIDEKVIRKVAKGLARKGLKAELAMTVLANIRCRDTKKNAS